MKRIILVLIILFNLFIPFSVYGAEKDKYYLYLSKEFLEYSDKYDLDVEHPLDQKLDYYKKSHLTIRDYLIYKIIYKKMNYTKATDFTDDLHFKASELDNYEINNKIRINVVDNYSDVYIKLIDNNTANRPSTLNLTSIDEFLDSDIYCYYLFSELIKDSSSPVEYLTSEKENEYGLIRNATSKKVLLNLNVKNNELVFDIPKNVNISDNISFLQLDSVSKNIDIDYLSVVFSKKDSNRKDLIVDKFNKDLVFIGICAFLAILVISFFVKNKEK